MGRSFVVLLQLACSAVVVVMVERSLSVTILVQSRFIGHHETCRDRAQQVAANVIVDGKYGSNFAIHWTVRTQGFIERTVSCTTGSLIYM